MSTSTLTSLAILKVDINRNVDYLDYLLPLISQVIIDNDIHQIAESSSIKTYVQESFGLEIPNRTIDIVLQRMARKRYLKRESKLFLRTDNLKDPGISSKSREVEREIRAVINGLQEFSRDTNFPIHNYDQATHAVCAFLAKFDIICLRAYLQGTAIPIFKKTRQTDIVLVSYYIQHIQKNDPHKFNSFLKLVQGHMLANALTCPDLENVSSTYRNMTFYLDTPLLIHQLGLEGEFKRTAINDLVVLLRQLDAKIAIFSHSLIELQNVLRGSAHFLDDPRGRSSIIYEARKNDTSKSDLLLLAESAEEKLSEYGFEIIDTPNYIADYQIDESIFENVIEDNLSYNNPRAKEYDINSVRSIYVLRRNKRILSPEKAVAILVTSNRAFAKAAWEYGERYEKSQTVSSVVTDFSLANMAWLKAPMGASSLPTTQVLAFSYAALEPTPKLLTKYMLEIDRLEKSGKFSEHEHQLLRSSPYIIQEIMHLTLGDEEELTTTSITQSLERITEQIREEETKKLIEERREHDNTRAELSVQRSELLAQQGYHQTQLRRNEELQNSIYWRCERRSEKFASRIYRLLILVFTLAVVIGVLVEFLPNIEFPGWLLITIPGLVVITDLIVPLTGISIVSLGNLRDWIQNRYFLNLLEREASELGLDFKELSHAKKEGMASQLTKIYDSDDQTHNITSKNLE